ncbi:hypothetical protein FQA39_LY18527 [Lamprigera yunnana]|nr:hypothetical protein FQA39_LY18527 [Lamprigera yunnana]
MDQPIDALKLPKDMFSPEQTSFLQKLFRDILTSMRKKEAYYKQLLDSHVALQQEFAKLKSAVSAATQIPKGFSKLEEALEAVLTDENDDVEYDLVLLPPDPAVVNDEEEDNDDDLVSLNLPKDVPDDLLKARQQLKRAECESDLNTDEEGSLKRKRKQKQYSSSDENDDNGVTIKNRLSTQIPSPPPPTSNQGNTSTDLEKHVTILETQDNSTHFTQALENVAKKLAKICQRLDAIEENQRKILEKVGNECSEPVQEVQNLPEGLIPCSSLDEIKRLENWLKEAVHEATLVWISYL